MTSAPMNQEESNTGRDKKSHPNRWGVMTGVFFAMLTSAAILTSILFSGDGTDLNAMCDGKAGDPHILAIEMASGSDAPYTCWANMQEFLFYFFGGTVQFSIVFVFAYYLYFQMMRKSPKAK